MHEEMIRRAQQGDTTAFRALVETYSPGAWRVAQILMTDREQVEDALQEAWIDVWRGLPCYDTARPFRPWLLAIVGNRCRMLRRRHTVPTQSLGEDLADGLPDAHDSYAEVTAREPDIALQHALACLAPEARELLELRYQTELELAEIAELYAVPLSTVKSRLYRTLAVLRAQLASAASTALDSSETTR
ncbi:MAG TPA: sigma-70 family RNA polymerase sigma factor [Ktedonobacterales bacterium]|nr:sigma-70 family RNA polymerase sigma factor [Ktedonobacterales bacterium]